MNSIFNLVRISPIIGARKIQHLVSCIERFRQFEGYLFQCVHPKIEIGAGNFRIIHIKNSYFKNSKYSFSHKQIFNLNFKIFVLEYTALSHYWKNLLLCFQLSSKVAVMVYFKSSQTDR